MKQIKKANVFKIFPASKIAIKQALKFLKKVVFLLQRRKALIMFAIQFELSN